MEQNHLPVFEAVEEFAPPEPKRKKPGTVQVVLIQSVCCAVFLLLFWLFKVVGGSGYDQLKTAFENAFQNNALLATVSGLFEEETPDESYPLSGGTTATSTGTTAGSTNAATVTTEGETKGTAVE